MSIAIGAEDQAGSARAAAVFERGHRRAAARDRHAVRVKAKPTAADARVRGGVDQSDAVNFRIARILIRRVRTGAGGVPRQKANAVDFEISPALHGEDSAFPAEEAGIVQRLKPGPLFGAVARVEHDLDFRVVGRKDFVRVGGGAGLAVAVNRDAVIGDDRITVGRRLEVERAVSGNVEPDHVAVMQIGERLLQRRFNQRHGVDVVGGVHGNDSGFGGGTKQGERRGRKKECQLFHASFRRQIILCLSGLLRKYAYVRCV